jgi:hypothetical protein
MRGRFAVPRFFRSRQWPCGHGSAGARFRAAASRPCLRTLNEITGSRSNDRPGDDNRRRERGVLHPHRITPPSVAGQEFACGRKTKTPARERAKRRGAAEPRPGLDNFTDVFAKANHRITPLPLVGRGRGWGSNETKRQAASPHRQNIPLAIRAVFSYTLARTLALAGVFSWPVLDGIPAPGVLFLQF